SIAFGEPLYILVTEVIGAASRVGGVGITRPVAIRSRNLRSKGGVRVGRSRAVGAHVGIRNTVVKRGRTQQVQPIVHYQIIEPRGLLDNLLIPPNRQAVAAIYA